MTATRMQHGAIHAMHDTARKTCGGINGRIPSHHPPALGEPPGYAQVVEARGSRTIYVSRQTALDDRGELVGKGDFAAQATQVFRNLSIALEAAQCTAANVVKLNVYLRDMANLAAYREARNRFLDQATPRAAPAVTLMEVSQLYGADFIIEIDAIAVA